MSSIKKLKKSILFILIGLLPIIIAYSQSQDSIVYSSENNPNENGLNYSGYIIELEEAPLIIKALELQGTVNNNERLLAGFGLFEPVARIGFNLLSTTNDNIDKRLDEHRELLEKEKDNALS
ncbi:hypothetical protein JXB41_03340, partial [Candidatus Woesearchaeota archaeon]|nr:hypothetical protein [Candidatus Woesearchaeota archaeon]